MEHSKCFRKSAFSRQHFDARAGIFLVLISWRFSDEALSSVSLKTVTTKLEVMGTWIDAWSGGDDLVLEVINIRLSMGIEKRLSTGNPQHATEH